MKSYLLALSLIVLFFSCNSSKDKITTVKPETVTETVNDTVRISSKDLEYDVIIIEPGFNTWLVTNAKPESFYTQNFLEARNIRLVTEWNNRAAQPSKYNSNLYEMQINYQNGVNYGFEVNYKMYNYFIYFQNKYKQNLLGGRVPLN